MQKIKGKWICKDSAARARKHKTKSNGINCVVTSLTWPPLANVFGQIWHLYGRSPEWIRICNRNRSLIGNAVTIETYMFLLWQSVSDGLQTVRWFHVERQYDFSDNRPVEMTGYICRIETVVGVNSQMFAQIIAVHKYFATYVTFVTVAVTTTTTN